MADLVPTPRTTLHRIPKRGSFERSVVEAILDEALVGHLGFVSEGQPFVIPTTYARVGETLYVHGAAASRMLRAAGSSEPLCFTVTLLDGLVLARSAFHHSMNYRSVVVLGRGRLVTDESERRAALDAIVEHVAPGRGAEVRGPNAKELAATLVVALPIDEASAKVRAGGPIDDEEDLALPCWAGHLPLSLVASAPVAADGVPAQLAPAEWITSWTRGRREKK